MREVWSPDGMVLTIKESRGLIPRHPNCMCSFIPSNVGESTSGQKRTKKEIEAAFRENFKAEMPKGRLIKGERRFQSLETGKFTLKKSPRTLKQQKEMSKWIGADTKIAAKRPKNIFAPTTKPKPKTPIKKITKPKVDTTKNRLPKHFHSPENTLAQRNVSVDSFDAGVSNFLNDSEIAESVLGKKYDDYSGLVSIAIREKKTVRTIIKEELSNVRGGNFERTLKQRFEKGVFDTVDKDLLKQLRKREDEIATALKKGYIIPSNEKEARQLIGDELTRLLGQPKPSKMSPSEYWYTENGRSIRVSNHSAVYFFEDSGVNIVPGIGRGTDVVMRSSSAINHTKIAEGAIKRNKALPAVDVSKATKRIEELTK